MTWADAPLFAPDCVHLNGRCYLFFCDAGNREGVAESFSPTGPFTDAYPIEGVDKDAIETWRACLLNGRVRTGAEGPIESDPTVRERLTQILLDDLIDTP